jgi:O-antigen/teichoic acid export membrane protein
VIVSSNAIPWERLFNVTAPDATAEAGPAATTLIAVFLIGLPLTVAGVVQSALQTGYLTSLWSIAGSLAALVALLIAITIHATLPGLILALTGTSLVVALINATVLFGKQQQWLAPRMRDFRGTTAKSLIRVGLLFMILQFAGVAAYQLDNIVIAQILGPEHVQQYAIPAKLFLLAPTVLSFALVPLWPAYREAISRGDSEWVGRTLSRSIHLGLVIVVPLSLLLIVASPGLIELWVGDAVSPSLPLLLGLGIWNALMGLSGPIAMLLNGANAIGFQALCAVLMAFANVALSILLVRHIGVAGAVFGSVAAQVIFVLAPAAWYVPRILTRIRINPHGATPRPT